MVTSRWESGRGIIEGVKILLKVFPSLCFPALRIYPLIAAYLRAGWARGGDAAAVLGR